LSLDAAEQGCQMEYLQTRAPNLGIILTALECKVLVYFMPISIILRPLGIFCGHLGIFYGNLYYFTAI
jgi:hypothetical protein